MWDVSRQSGFDISPSLFIHILMNVEVVLRHTCYHQEKRDGICHHSPNSASFLHLSHPDDGSSRHFNLV